MFEYYLNHPEKVARCASMVRVLDVNSTSFSLYEGSLNFEIEKSFHFPDHSTKYVRLDVAEAVPCGMIINELVSNALKYAFEGCDDG